jgi:hypothetical protein
MRAPKTERTGTVGESEVEAEFRRLGWAAHRTSPGQDNGTDFLVSPRERRWELGFYLGVQVKSGPTAFRRPKREDGEVTGWWFIDEKGEELGGWARYPTPQIVVLCNLETRTSYWEHVTAEGIRSTGKGDKLFIPASQVLGPDTERELRAVAASFGSRGSLEGTWVDGLPVSPPDRLRHALIVPRLIAPHPNFGAKKLTPEQAIAMLTQVRAAELDRYAQEQRHVPRGPKGLDSKNWKWRFYGALWRRIEDGEAESLRQVLEETRRAPERAAVIACLSAQMIGAACPQDALDLLDTELDADKLGVVDHGWLAGQRARALAELGQTETAREEARVLRNLRTAAPEDQTAIAISASAAALFANLSEPGVELAAETMKATDVPTGWFRAQTVRSGLANLAERSFEEAMQDERDKWSREDIAHNRLLAGALEASHAADQVGWARLTGIVGRDELLAIDRKGEVEKVADALTTLRLAGDDKALKLAVPHLCDDGPCLAVTAVLREITPQSATRTTGLADLVLIELGGDLADRESADRLSGWLMGAIDDPTPFKKRTSPTYLLDVQLVSSLAGVVGAASVETQRGAIRMATEAGDFGDQILLERTWVRMLVGVPRAAWDPELAEGAFEVAAKEDPGTFDRALIGCAALAGHPDAREYVLREVRAGSSETLWGLGPISDLPSDAVSGLLKALAKEVRKVTRAYRRGERVAFGPDDPVHLFTLVGIWHSEMADWKTLTKLLSEREVLARHKRGALRTLTWGAERLPDRPRQELAEVASSMIADGPSGARDAEAPDLRALSCIVAASLGALAEPDLWVVDLLAANRQYRRFGARLAGKLGRPEDTGTLGALTVDGDPYLRAIAAAALAEKLGDGKGTPTIRTLLESALEDPGRAAPLAVAEVLSHMDFAEPLRQIAEARLQTHPAASVRLAASPAIH